MRRVSKRGSASSTGSRSVGATPGAVSLVKLPNAVKSRTELAKVGSPLDSEVHSRTHGRLPLRNGPNSSRFPAARSLCERPLFAMTFVRIPAVTGKSAK